MGLNILFTVLLVLVNGFFVAAEFALVKVRLSQIELRAKEGNRLAKLTLTMLQDLEAYLSASQLGITLASLGIGFLGEPAIAQFVEPALDVGRRCIELIEPCGDRGHHIDVAHQRQHSGQSPQRLVDRPGMSGCTHHVGGDRRNRSRRTVQPGEEFRRFGRRPSRGSTDDADDAAHGPPGYSRLT